MNVRDLARQLTYLVEDGEGDLEVFTEGCDCNGDVGAVSTQRWDNGHASILLERSEYSDKAGA